MVPEEHQDATSYLRVDLETLLKRPEIHSPKLLQAQKTWPFLSP